MMWKHVQRNDCEEHMLCSNDVKVEAPIYSGTEGTFALISCCGMYIFKIMREIVLTITSKLAVQFFCAYELLDS